MGEDIQFIDGKRFEDVDGGYVEFTAIRGDEGMKFRISRTALESLAAEPIPTGGLLALFDDMKERIWDIARRNADAIGGGHSGGILIRDTDI